VPSNPITTVPPTAPGVTRPERGRPFLIAAIVIVVASALQPSVALAAPCWQPPVVGRIVDPFRAPTCPYCSGNRGLEYRVGDDVAVRSVAAGTVTYSGTIAGTTYVIVDLANGWKVTYGRLTSSSAHRGDRIGRGAVVGRASGDFYFGLRIGGEYRDPQPHLGRLTGRPRLVPVDGTSRRPPPTAVVTCPSGAVDQHR
jgi:murein DD-endopeptidase MepM/ murein hydrolase activator NlpD